MASYNWFRKSGMTAEDLALLYQQKPDSEIGLMFDVTDVSVSQMRRKLGVETISSHVRLGSTVHLLSPMTLADLYKKLGDAKIAQLHGVTKPVIRRLRMLWGISTISKSERSTRTEPLTEEQKEICIGKMLGDGHLLRRGVLRIEHSLKQLKYVEHVQNKLQPFSRKIRKYSRIMDNGNTAWEAVFTTDQHVWLKELRHQFYPEGKRIFPVEILRSLTPRSLAYWYYDDGHLGDNLPSFALGDCSNETSEMVIQEVGKRFGLDTYRKADSGNCAILGIRAVSRERFRNLVEAPAEECGMGYKVPKA
jgi:hypothetical protein